jgi:hypothetical protein
MRGGEANNIMPSHRERVEGIGLGPVLLYYPDFLLFCFSHTQPPTTPQVSVVGLRLLYSWLS